MGIHEHPTRYAPDKSKTLIIGESVIKAVEDAGLRKQDVDALFCAYSTPNFTSLDLADYLNLTPKYLDTINVGGGSFEFHLSHAIMGIAAGRFNVAVIAYAITIPYFKPATK